ncbi:hypothetical protein VPNG_01346 [Cytospora leucostoma]|uniref:Centrosomin N-terminal motif 1 domain-containing protein n=1 Tax=Cytospora leucostoma TaxID=1230097 RepID=A0A423XMC9_9PEZI|nr:hypothetical protein VPNG_01346 [Cytospora leucostoma]
MGSNVERPPTPIAKTSIKDSHSSSKQEPQSTLLHERLQLERRSEIQRNLNRLAGEMSGAGAAGSRAATATPKQSDITDVGRPGSKDGGGDTGKKGLALKEMEQTMSTLHKQNFDLKLELFHRRERQSVLEDKLEALEEEFAASKETNEVLQQALEKRDKAVEEAVHMIVSLETRIELLLREREMVRQVDADNISPPRLAQAESTPHNDNVESSEASDTTVVRTTQGLTRMPSCLSVQTENTENLRNVYLGTQGSLLSLSRTEPRVENVGTMMSPSMSVLSESSFTSIYGDRPVPDTHLRHAEAKALVMNTPTRPNRRNTLDTRDVPRESIELGDTGSPLNDRPDLGSSAAMHNVQQPILPGKDFERAATVKPIKPQSLVRVRNSKEKPTPSRRVITDISAARSQTLPPTPDTMSSSRIQSQCPDDNPVHDQSPEDSRFSDPTRFTTDQAQGVESEHWRFKDSDVAQPPSVTAFTGRNEFSPGTYFENRLSVPRRPRSADETTISRHKGGWDSGSEPDDAASEVSSFDYWMREGLRPSNGGLGRAPHRARTSHRMSSRGSTDLFGFPPESTSWKPDGRYGSLGGLRYIGDDAPLAPALDALGASLPAPESGLFGSGVAGPSSPRPAGTAVAPPPAPYRRSSLQARTQVPGTSMTARTPGSLGRHHDTESGRTGYFYGQPQSSPGGWQAHVPQGATPTSRIRPQAQEEDGTTNQKRHYPPTASYQQQQQTARPRSRGLTSLFRRSLGTAHPQPSASVPNDQSPFPPPKDKDESEFTTGPIPAWEIPSYQAVEEASATPPPILRNRIPGTGMGASGGAALHAKPRNTRYGKSNGGPGLGAGLSTVLGTHDGGAPLTSSSQEQENFLASAGQGHGRRWFGLGRVAGLKHGGP